MKTKEKLELFKQATEDVDQLVHEAYGYSGMMPKSVKVTWKEVTETSRYGNQKTNIMPELEIVWK